MTESLLDTNQNDQIQIDPNKNYFEELVGDGKKFKDTEALAKGKFMADEMVETLKRQQDELRTDYLKLRDELNTGASLKEILDQLKTQKTPQLDEQPPVERAEHKPVFDPKELESLVDQKISQREVERRHDTNFNSVKTKLLERFGNNYAQIVKDKTNSLGLSKDLVDNLARTAPEAFFNTLGLNEQRQEPFQSPPRSSQRQDNFAPNSGPKRTWSWYQNLKKSDPKAYYDPKTNVQMLQDRITLGDNFEDGDYGR